MSASERGNKFICMKAESSSEIKFDPFFLLRTTYMIANEWIVAYLTNQAFKATANNETIQNMTAQNVNIQYEKGIVTQQTLWQNPK